MVMGLGLRLGLGLYISSANSMNLTERGSEFVFLALYSGCWRE